MHPFIPVDDHGNWITWDVPEWVTNTTPHLHTWMIKPDMTDPPSPKPAPGVYQYCTGRQFGF